MQFFPIVPTSAALLLVATSVVSRPTVYLIRHGEKPSSGNGLNAQGEERAQCLTQVFGPNSTYHIGHIMAETPQSGEVAIRFSMQPKFHMERKSLLKCNQFVEYQDWWSCCSSLEREVERGGRWQATTPLWYRAPSFARAWAPSRYVLSTWRLRLCRKCCGKLHRTRKHSHLLGTCWVDKYCHCFGRPKCTYISRFKVS
jgi:hypothetical protein